MSEKEKEDPVVTAEMSSVSQEEAGGSEGSRRAQRLGYLERALRLLHQLQRELGGAAESSPQSAGQDREAGTSPPLCLPGGLSLQQAREEIIRQTLARYQGHQSHTATALGVCRRTISAFVAQQRRQAPLDPPDKP